MERWAWCWQCWQLQTQGSSYPARTQLCHPNPGALRPFTIPFYPCGPSWFCSPLTFILSSIHLSIHPASQLFGTHCQIRNISNFPRYLTVHLKLFFNNRSVINILSSGHTCSYFSPALPGYYFIHTVVTQKTLLIGKISIISRNNIIYIILYIFQNIFSAIKI